MASSNYTDYKIYNYKYVNLIKINKILHNIKHLKTENMQQKILKYRNMQYMSKYDRIWKNMQNKTLYFVSIDYKSNL